MYMEPDSLTQKQSQLNSGKSKMYIKRSKSPAKLALISGVSGALLLAAGAAHAVPPPNDNCDTATVIPSTAPNPPYTDSVDTTGATLDPSDPLLSCNTGDDGNNTVWYKWTPDASGIVNITTDGSTTTGGGELDTAHGMYTGSCGALVEYACVDVGLNDDLVVNVEAGTEYFIKVGEFAGGVGGGNVVLSVEEPPEPEQYIIESIRFGESAPIRDIVAGEAAPAVAGDGANMLDRLAEIPNPTRAEGTGRPESSMTSPGSMVAGEKGAFRGRPKVLQSFDGGSNNDNGIVLGGFLAPPDTIGDVGMSHYVQMVNLLTLIYDKEGNLELGPFPTNLFFAGLGGQCEFTNNGDPIVLYDEETDRWLITQFAASLGDGLCVAVSTSGDPTGTYYQYEFDFGGIGFPDYPKYGFSTDSINVMANMFSPFQGSGIGVIDKAEAMQPGPATMIFFILGASEFGFIPGDNDGPVFDNVKPTFFTNNGFSGSGIDVWEVTPDYDTPENSTATEVTTVPVTPYDSDLCDAFREQCIAQPGSGTGTFPTNIPFLEAIADRMMHRAQMRSWGDRIEAVLSHTVDADGSGKAGVRWYEFRNQKDRGWTLKKENTFSPDGDNRWMGSIAMNAAGETCLGYSISSQTTYPSIGITGRKGTANHMNVKEVVAYDGNATGFVQRQTGRWGDYSSMNIDPVDDTCWYTTEYASPIFPLGGTERFGWATRIIQFQLPGNNKGN
jgi:hypothetical protein